MKLPSPSCFSARVDLSLKEKLKNDLADRGFTFSVCPHAFFAASKGSIRCVLYESGKLTVQGKDKDDFIAFYLEPEILGNVAYTGRDLLIDPSARIGLDEAGKGDFFGPLCIAGIFVPEGAVSDLLAKGVKDSKKLGDAAIVKIAASLRSYPHKVLRLFPETYNDLYPKFGNLNRMLAWGHATVLEELSKRTGCKKAILDQFAFEGVMESMLKSKKLEVDLTQRVRGEEDPVVAAASILARAGFVQGIQELENTTGLLLPKGASRAVIDAGKEALAGKGESIFPRIAKMHFKTLQEVLGAQGTLD